MVPARGQPLRRGHAGGARRHLHDQRGVHAHGCRHPSRNPDNHRQLGARLERGYFDGYRRAGAQHRHTRQLDLRTAGDRCAQRHAERHGEKHRRKSDPAGDHPCGHRGLPGQQQWLHRPSAAGDFLHHPGSVRSHGFRSSGRYADRQRQRQFDAGDGRTHRHGWRHEHAGARDIAFTAINEGQSISLPVTLTNQSNFAFNVLSVAISGAAAGDFTQTNNCGTSVSAAPAFCTITVTFAPTATGNRNGTLTVTTDAAARHRQLPCSVPEPHPPSHFCRPSATPSRINRSTLHRPSRPGRSS